jgi:hypothetical protein
LRSTLDTPVVVSSKFYLPSAEVFKKLDFEEFPVKYSSFEIDLKEERIEILSSLDIEKCFSLDIF